ncbi:hypothetical protein BDZ89DRAFT_1138756 [Hymenopellis radicata]|nr:hypothetical protein BDZ89DRAFT_1138756 [Hymenopellis radicata]
MRSAFVSLVLCLTASASPARFTRVRSMRRAAVDLQNGQDAIALNDKFKSLTADSACTAGEDACVNDQFAQCVGDKFVLQPCASGTICAALPTVGSAGTIITCTTADDLAARLAATGATGAGGSNDNNGNGDAQNGTGATNATDTGADGTNNAGNSSAAGDAGNNGDIQSSLTLDPSVIADNFNNDGIAALKPGEVASPSLTSANNFINFCATVNLPITNGKQVATGSCNPAPMGVLPAKEKIPSSKFTFPVNFQQFDEGESFTISMAIQNLDTGNFVNAQDKYFSAPQTLNNDGVIIGHSHVVIEAISAFNATDLLDPVNFAFFKGLNGAAVNGILTADVTNGLPAGFYKLSSINAAANHQPVLAPIAQHGSCDDVVYFQVVAGGGNNGGQ